MNPIDHKPSPEAVHAPKKPGAKAKVSRMEVEKADGGYIVTKHYDPTDSGATPFKSSTRHIATDHHEVGQMVGDAYGAKGGKPAAQVPK